MEDYELEKTHNSVTKASLTFLLEGIDPRDLAEDGLSITDFADSDSEAGGVRETPSCQELAIEGERLTKQGEHSEAIPLLEAALEASTEGEDEQLLSVLWSLLGNAHFYTGDYKRATVCHTHDLAICSETKDKKSQAQAYCNLGIAYRKTGYLQRARACYERYLDISEKLEDSRSISKGNHNLGELHLTLARLKLQRDGRLEDSPEAKEHLNKAVEFLEKHLEYVNNSTSQASLARAHGSLGLAYELLRDTDRAIDHHQQRLQIAIELSDKAHEGKAYCSIGNCLRAIIQPDKALECYKRGLSIATELQDKTGEGVCHCNIGTTYEILYNLEESLEHHQQHLDLMKDTSSLHGQAMALSNIAKTYEYMANVSRAVDALEKLAELQKQLNDERQLKITKAQLAQLNEQQFDTAVSSNKKSSTASNGSGGAGGGGGGGGGGGVIKGTWKKIKEKRAKRRSNTLPVLMPHKNDEQTSNGKSSPKPSRKNKSAKQKDKQKEGDGKSKEKVKDVSGKTNGTPSSGAEPKTEVRLEEVKFDSDKKERVETPNSVEEGSLSRNNSKGDHVLRVGTGGGSLRGHTSDEHSDLSQSMSNCKLSSSESTSFSAQEVSMSDTSQRLEPDHDADQSLNQDTGKGFDNEPPRILDSEPNETDQDLNHDSNHDFDQDLNHEPSNELDHSLNQDLDHSTPATLENGVRSSSPTEEGDCIDGTAHGVYDSFGSEKHKESLQRIEEYMKSINENKPCDLSVLQDWDGWAVASKDIVIQSSNESKLI